MEKYRVLIDKLIDKNFKPYEILLFLNMHFIDPFPIIIDDPRCPGCNRKAWGDVHSKYIEEAITEIDFTKHK